jgi:hypothetical protein
MGTKPILVGKVGHTAETCRHLPMGFWKKNFTRIVHRLLGAVDDTLKHEVGLL